MGTLDEFIKKYHLVVDSTKSSDQILFIRSSIRTEEEAQVFMKKFGQKTSTIWRVHYGNYNPQRVVFRKAWVCRHSSIRSTGVPENNCDAKLDILVKKINPYTSKNDTFLLKKPPLPCIIRMHFKHNHNCQDDFKYLKVPDEVKELFNGYFDNGYGVSKAIRLHQEHLQNVKTTTSVHFIPSKRQAYYLYRIWREQRNLTGVPCDGIVSNEPWNLFEWDKLIGAIPHENPPLKRVKKLASDSPIIIRTTKEKFTHDKSGAKDELLSSTNTDAILQECNPVTVMCASNGICSKNSFLPTVYVLDRPVQTQHIANSSSHLNGSVLTVMNSNSLLSSCLVSSPVSPTLTPISSTGNLETISSKPARNFILLTKESSPKNGPSAEDTLEIPTYTTDVARSNYLLQSKVMDLSSSKFASNVLQKKSNSGCDLSSQNCTSQSDIRPSKNSFLSMSSKQTTINGQICPPVFKDIGISSTLSMNQDSIISSYKIVVPEKSNEFKSHISSANLFNNSNTSCIETPAVNTLLSTNSECSETSVTMNKQIHITNTVHQSGAQICMKSSTQSIQDPIVNALHVSELLNFTTPSKELIKIKEEPLHVLSAEKLENSDLSPTIIKVSSVSMDEILPDGKVVRLPSIKKEKDENDTVEYESSIYLSNNSENAIKGKDEDHLFLLSLLPELRQLPTMLKNELKSDIQSLISQKVLQNRRKRRRL